MHALSHCDSYFELSLPYQIYCLTNWKDFGCHSITTLIASLTINVNYLFCMHSVHGGRGMYYVIVILVCQPTPIIYKHSAHLEILFLGVYSE